VLIPELDRALDRLPRGGRVEVVDAKQIVEEIWDAPFEPVELGERVLPDRDQEADGNIASAENGCELVGKRPRTRLVLVIEEVLLELVEKD
jgi:hypothetical protein